MATTLAPLVDVLCGRLEEDTPANGGPTFWSETYEMLPALVDAMFQAALVTGAIQAINVPVTLAANTTFFSLQNNTTIGIPAGVIAALRLRLPWPIRKTTLKGLSDVIPGWQNTAASTSLRAWFPLGVSQFGIFPQLTSPQTAIMDFLVAPTTAVRPYTTAITVPFLDEFMSAFPEYAAVILRSKELGLEAEAAETVMNAFLTQMKGLSMWQNRLDGLVLSNTYGAAMPKMKRDIV
jgi:hypothetical protein